MDFKTCTHDPLFVSQKFLSRDNKGILAGLVLVVLFCISISVYADARYGGEHDIGEYQRSEQSTAAADAGTGGETTRSHHSKGEHHRKMPPLKPYPRLLSLRLIAPHTAQASIPLSRIRVTLRNPGEGAPNSRLRFIIHHKEHKHDGDRHELNPDNVTVEVLEGESWKPVILDMVDESLLGVIGVEGVSVHNEHHKRGGFAVPAGFNKTWQLRVTFSVPGEYVLVAAVSPDNGSRHLARPAHSVIEVQ